jgi:hypothetical protein
MQASSTQPSLASTRVVEDADLPFFRCDGGLSSAALRHAQPPHLLGYPDCRVRTKLLRTGCKIATMRELAQRVIPDRSSQIEIFDHDHRGERCIIGHECLVRSTCVPVCLFR